jgi:hypothetical protein
MYQNQPFTGKLEKLKFTTFFYKKNIQIPITATTKELKK